MGNDAMHFCTFEIFVMDVHDVLCKVIYCLMYVITSTSSWILVAMTLQRAASIVWPHRNGEGAWELGKG